jgi:hypothetical protein
LILIVASFFIGVVALYFANSYIEARERYEKRRAAALAKSRNPADITPTPLSNGRVPK